MKHPFPLRYTLPFGLLLLGLTLSAIGVTVSYVEIDRRNTALMQQRAAGLGMLVVPDLEEELPRRGRDAGMTIMRRLAVVPQLKTALLCDEAGVILCATREPLVGRKLPEVLAGAAAVVQAARSAKATQFQLTPDHNTLWSAFSLKPDSGSAPLWFCTESDVAAQMAPAIDSLVRRATIMGALILGACAMVWFYFDRTITRRAQSLVDATEALATGRHGSPVLLGGSDELARLGIAFSQAAHHLRVRDETIRLSEERLALAIRASDLGTWDWNIVTGECIDNDTWFRMFGYEPGELPANVSTWNDLNHPEDRARLAGALNAHFEGRTLHFECEHRMRHKSGTWVWVADRGRVTERDATGKPCRAVGTTLDITARKQTESALRASEARFRAIFNTERECVKVVSPDGQLTEINAAGLVLLEASTLAEAQAKPLGDYVAPDFRDSFQRLHGKVMRGESGHLQFEVVGLRGTRRWLDTHAVPLRTDDGRIDAMLGVTRDITERKRTEERLMQAEQEQERHLALLEASLDSLTEGVIVSDLKGNLYYWNRAALNLHGYASLEECRRSLPEFRDTYDFVNFDGGLVPYEQWPLARILRGEVLSNYELRLQNHHKKWEKFFAYSGTLARDVSGQPILAVVSMTDITSRRQLEEQLRQSQKMDAVGQLAGGVAHDFNNILTAIIVRSEMTGLRLELPGDAREALAEIGRLGHRAAGLTSQLLAFSRRSVMQRQHINLSEVVAADAKLLRRLVGEDIQLELRLHPRPLPIYADAGMLGQVLLNLAVNARDAMPRGGRLRIETGEREIGPEEMRVNPDATPGPHACLRIEDTGTGIAPENLARIFEPFFTTKAVGKGTGLGLATVFGIVRQHQGWITVESKLGHGAAFTVFLSIAQPPEPESEADANRAMPRGSETILLVEDEDSVRSSMSWLLRNHGYQVLEADHGHAAVQLWRKEKNRIALLLTDLVMPGGMTGNELAIALQSESAALKVIFTTGYSAEIAGRDLKLQARQGFLQKPFAPSELLTTVRQVLDAR